MRVLLVGGGGREHALAWKLRQSPGLKLWAAPGNPGIADAATLEAVKADDIGGLCDLATRHDVELTVVGPEAPLCAGIVDALAARGLGAFGPTREAAALEGSKAFAKEFMARHGIPTGSFGAFDSAAAADRFVDASAGPLVVKADGLCAGKGVVVCDDRAEAHAAVRRMLVEREFGAAGARVVLEERLRGREASLMALSDGERVVLLASAEDHKAVHDGDRGPNTGGMGAYSPSPLCTPQVIRFVLDAVMVPTVRGMAREGRPFRGVLYAGLMLTADRGPMVLEFNCRFGDPETQVVMLRFGEDLVPWLSGAAAGRLPAGDPRWDPRVAVSVVLAAPGYPGSYPQGAPITGVEEAAALPDVAVFHAGTRRRGTELVTAGGRVLDVCALGADLGAARARAYEAVARLRFEGMHFRRDIAARGQSLARPSPS
ncbi:MAG: phosphoribosylamine--glycine ligase [Deltaproteobacteria bacterium]|nr:phosphoribosylamine--glycine ligase [Deltaproteobacteria bacterium]